MTTTAIQERNEEPRQPAPRTSGWLLIDQPMIDRFADVIDDHQFIHVDPERAAREGAFGGTIAHGFLLLSLLTRLSREVFEVAEPGIVEVNYGFDKVRFLTPVRAGSRVRGHFERLNRQEKGSGVLETHRVSIEIEGQPKPAIAAEWLVLTTR